MRPDRGPAAESPQLEHTDGRLAPGPGGKRTRSVYGRLLILVVALVAVIQFPTFFAVDSAVRHNVLDRADQDLDRGSLMFAKLLEVRGSQLSESAQVAARDLAFREVFDGGDQATVQSVLVDQGGRIAASFALLIQPDGTVSASTADAIPAARPFPFGQLLGDSGKQRVSATVAALDGQPYQIVLAPVMAPRRMGWVGMGFALDEVALSKMRELTGLEISIAVSRQDGATQWLSTLPADERHELDDYAAQSSASAKLLAVPQYLTRVVVLGGEGPDAVEGVLQLSVLEALQPYSRLNEHLTFIALLSMLISILGAWALARGVTRPLGRLMIAARRIGAGDYQAEVPVTRNDELGELAGMFNEMQRGIAERERHIEHEAFHDSLTGLPNRSHVEALLAESITVGKQTKTPLAVLMLDINRFKEINDTLGHNVGDLLLIGIGERLLELTRPTDTVARLGGDEFLMVIPGASAERARQRAEQIVLSVSQSLHLQSMDLFPDISIGIAMFPEHGDNAIDLLRRSDIAMYDAKHAHQSIAVYETGRDATHLRRLSLVNELRRAVTNDELRVYYQPMLAMDEQTTTHVEALVRWQHPRDGLITPDEFIPLAEHAGSIHLITDWMLRNAIRQCREWSEMGLDMGVAVNISAMDLATGKLPFVVRNYLTQYGVAPNRLLLEITESAVMRDTSYALGVLNHLKACGVKLAIDDFGTGYSSLAHLKRLPVDELKIDKSFVMNMARDSDDAIIVRSTIELGRNMGLSVVAEGVEDEQTLRMLKNFRCDVVQGYLISRPLPTDEMTEWLKAQRSGADSRPLRLVKAIPVP